MMVCSWQNELLVASVWGDVAVLRVTAAQSTTVDALLPEEFKRLPEELARIDRFLDDDAFIAPWRGLFAARLGRPLVPIEVLLRLLYLKHRYQLGYESLCAEVADSLTWRRFCRIPLDARVPHPATVSKLVVRAGPEVIGQLNTVLVGKLAEGKVLRCRRLRVDTTVVAADIHYPTDAGLLEHAVRTLARLTGGLKARGAASRTAFRDRRRSAARRLRALSYALRRRGIDTRAEVDRVTGELACLAEASLHQAAAVARNAARALIARRSDGRLGRLAADLDAAIAGTRRLLEQTRQRLRGVRVIPDRLVSLSDPDARPIRRGKLGRPNEFGYICLLAEDERGFIADCELLAGNPPDAPLLVPAVKRAAQVTGRVPGSVAADRGFGTAANDRALAELGVARLGLQRRGKLSRSRAALERTRPFRRLRRWRVGIEARISHLKRGFGLGRTRLRGLDGARTWVGLGVFAYNLQRMTITT
jgi:transposase, IS5 family